MTQEVSGLEEKVQESHPSSVWKKWAQYFTVALALVYNSSTLSSAQEQHLQYNSIQSHSYQIQFRQERRDWLKFVPFATVRKFPRSGNEGLYGWTIRGSGIINQRDDLEFIDYRLQNAVHEAIHTNDEYETRRLTEWIMTSMFPREEKYKGLKPKGYLA